VGNLVAFFLIVWAFSISDQQTYQNRLNRNGLSASALRVKTNSKERVATLIQKLADSHLKNYQVQLTDAAHPTVTYVFAQGDYTQLPISSGRMLTDSDFSAPVPFVVAGDAVKDRLYQPANQAYYYDGSRYLSVVGTVGAANSTAINDHIFISLSTAQTTLKGRLRHYTINIDGTLATTKQKVAKQIFKVKSFAKPKYKNSNQTAWAIPPIALTTGILLVALVLTIGIARFFALAEIKQLNDTRLDRTLYRHLTYGYVRQYFFYALVGIGAGYFLGSSRLYLLSYQQIFLTVALYGILQAAMVVVKIVRTKQKHVLTEEEEDRAYEKEHQG
jgi:hypothetical protein